MACTVNASEEMTVSGIKVSCYVILTVEKGGNYLGYNDEKQVGRHKSRRSRRAQPADDVSVSYEMGGRVSFAQFSSHRFQSFDYMSAAMSSMCLSLTHPVPQRFRHRARY